MSRLASRQIGLLVAPALFLLGALSAPSHAQPRPLTVPNGSFEEAVPGELRPAGWHIGIGGGAEASAQLDSEVVHSGAQSVRIANASPRRAFVYFLLSSDPIAVEPLTTYRATVWVRGRGVRGASMDAVFPTAGEARVPLPQGDFAWRRVSLRFTTPAACSSITLRIASDDVTDALWVDDFGLERAARQFANLPEAREERPHSTIFPVTPAGLARRLLVVDCQSLPKEERMAIAALQGLVNRRGARLYVLNPTNPPGMDEKWLRWLQQRGYTGPERRVACLRALLAMFRSEVRGVIVVDPALPGTVNGAFMLAGLLRGLPATHELASRLGLPVVADLRGRWRRNVEVYRHIRDRYWGRMNHHVLAWHYPLSGYQGARDYMVQHNIFSFWVSSHGDNEPGADPEAEDEFLDELLAATPANIPVMGWPAHGDDRGLSEYQGVRRLSEYGKFVAGTEFCSNLSVHSAVRPATARLRQKPIAGPGPTLARADAVYLALNILDSGDSLWYWQLHQRTIWADPERGRVPIGWCMNVTLADALPAVLEWYFAHATANDRFFAAVSGLGYMNTQVYAERFRGADRERILRDYAVLTGRYCRRLGLEGVSLYNGGWSDATPPSNGLLERIARQAGVRFVLMDLGRHEKVEPDRAAYMLRDVPVFHTLTRYQVWSTSAEVLSVDREQANAWLAREIQENTPRLRPAFFSAMAISWYYKPSWIRDLISRLPSHYLAVRVEDLARLFRQHAAGERESRLEERP